MASAGTGKTWLLVSRLLRLLLHGARAESILAITFTRKAAAEMQSRLADRLLQLACADEQELKQLLRELSLTPDDATCSRARRLYEELLQRGKSVRTTTFHAFCQEILRRFPLEAEIPPGFELLEGGGELTREAWDLLIEQATLQADGPLAQQLETLLDYCGGLSGMSQALFSFLTHRGDWWAYTEGQSAPLDYATERLAQQLGIDEGTEPLSQLFIPAVEEQLNEYSRLLALHPTATNLKRLEQLADAQLPDHPLERRYHHLSEAMLTQKGEPRACKASATQAKKMGERGEEHFIALHGALCSALLETREQLTALTTLRACSAWYQAGMQLLENFQQLKAEQRQLDFTDLEWRAYRLLNQSENAQWVQYKLDQRIEHLLVDEFQDTNPTQWRLLLPLLQEMAAGGGERERSVFLVGDAKQSIYRFRRAEPRLFQTAHQWLTDHLGAHGYPLHTSWRSASAIMQGVNRLFGDNGPMQGILSDFTPHTTHRTELWGRITLLPLLDDDGLSPGSEVEPSPGLRNPLHQPRPVEYDQRHLREGEQIASEITRLITEQTPIGAAGIARKLHYGDVMILVRSRSHVGEYEKALRQAGIPYIGAERGTLLESLEVRDMVALLEVLLTPYNNLSLAQVLRSPLFDCDNDDLAQLAMMERELGNWYQRLMVVEGGSNALQRAARLLTRWRTVAGILPIHDLLDRIFNEGDLLARYRAAYPPHLQGRGEANLTRFLELALTIDSGRYPSLGRFLARLGEMRHNSDEAPDEAPGGESDRVRIMTIHASKGLEAPVLFIADSARSHGSDRPFNALVDWPAEATRPEALLLIGKKSQQGVFTRQLLEQEQQQERREDGNLLYVALTRARQLLYITGSAPRRGDELGWYGVLRRALDPLDEIAADKACVLESGTPPIIETAPTQPEDDTPVGLPEALRRPMEVPSSWYEIAPSRQQTVSEARGGIVDEDGRVRGIAIHRMLELLSTTEGLSRSEALLQLACEQGLSHSDHRLQQWADEAEQIMNAPAMAEIFHPESGEAMNEAPLIYRQQDGCTVHGVIDRLLLRGDEAWVIDYKTHRHATPENIAELAQDYADQMGYYAEGVQHLWPHKVIRTFLLFTSCTQLHEMKSTPIELTEQGQ